MAQASDSRFVITSVVFYMTTALIMVIANKAVLNSVPDLPIFFLWLQLIVAVILLRAAKIIGWISLPKIQLPIIKRLLPLIAINTIGLSMNTLCLKYVDASIFQVARGLVLPFTVLFSYIFLRQHSSLKVVISCAIVCMGFASGMFSGGLSTSHISVLGIFYGVASSITTAFHAIVIKKAHNVVSNTLDLAYYNNILSAVGLIPLVFLNGELLIAYATFLPSSIATSVTSLSKLADISDVATVNDTHFLSGTDIRGFVIGVLVTGFFGFLINIAGFLQIKVTSPVTHMISSAVRGVLQALVSIFVFNECINISRFLGIALILCGSTIYTYVKSLENSTSASSFVAATSPRKEKDEMEERLPLFQGNKMDEIKKLRGRSNSQSDGVALAAEMVDTIKLDAILVEQKGSNV